jgi:hypothetical protein
MKAVIYALFAVVTLLDRQHLLWAGTFATLGMSEKIKDICSFSSMFLLLCMQ